MKRACDACGKTYEAQRKTSRYCGSLCRTRVSRAGGGKPAELVAIPAPVARQRSTEAVPEPDDDLSIEASTIDTLQRAGRLNTPLGRVAVALARRLDNPDRETGSALASLATRHQAQLEAAMVGANKAADPLDDLRARRDRKRNAV